MNLKTSLFNKMIIKSDLKRFWWVSALNTLAILVFAIYSQFQRYLRPSYSSLYGYMPNMETEFIYSKMHGVLSICIFILIAFGGFTAVMLSLYLNSQNSVSFNHGLPLKRKTHFFSHFLAGTILLIAPALINGIILVFMKLNPQISPVLEFSHILKWFYMYAVYVMVVYSGTVFVSLLTGNAFATIGITAGIAALPLIVTGFLMTLFERSVYGYYAVDFMDWMEYIYLSPQKLEKAYVLIYLAFIILLISLSYLLYKKRDLENNGEIIAFPKIKPFFVYAVAVILGVLGYMYCTAISNSASMWWILPFGILGVIIAYMLSKKAFVIKGAVKPALIFTACFLVLFGIIKFDLTGYEKRVPKLEDVLSVKVDNEKTEKTYTPLGGEITYNEVTKPILTDKNEIENVISLHKYLISNREITDKENYIMIPITYTLNNGKELKRRYSVSMNECREYLKNLYETDVMKKFDYPVTDDTEKEVVEICVSDRRIANSLVYYDDNPEAINRIVEAFKKDISNLKFEDNYERNYFVLRGHTRIMFRHIKPAKNADGKELTREQLKGASKQNTYNINDNYVNTVAVLKELGFYDGHPNAEDIKAVGITTHIRNEEGVILHKPDSEVFTYSQQYDRINEILSSYKHKITDRSEIEEIYNYVSEEAIYRTNRGENFIEIAFITDNNVMQFSLEFDDNIPEFFQKYIEKGSN